MKKHAFAYLNTVQFLDAFNENLFKLIIAFYLIYKEGLAETNKISALTGALAILPFVLFSSLGGIFADKWSKTGVIRVTRYVQIIIVFLGLACMLYDQTVLLYADLFLFSLLAAIFGPSKYGIIPELVPEKKFLWANGMIAAFTFFAVIFGTSLASVLDNVLGQLFAIMMAACVAVAIFGTILSYFIPLTDVANPRKKWSAFIYKELYESFRQMAQNPLLLISTFAFGFFMFVGAFVQINLIPFSVHDLMRDPSAGGYFFIFSAVGVGIGSLVATKLSGKLSIVPKAGMAMGISCILFIFHEPYWLSAIWLLGLGFSGGLFLVPPQTYILAKSPIDSRGRNFATANFLSFVFAFLASGAIFFFNTMLKLDPAVSFAIIGGITLLVSIAFYIFIAKA